VARVLDHACPRVWHECGGGFRGRCTGVGSGYSFTAKGPKGADISRHEVANARLGALGMNAANTFLLYSLGAVLFCWVVFWMLWRKPNFLKL
jgi:hypothetical protein